MEKPNVGSSTRSGWLYKQGVINSKWRQRWCVVNNNRLYYFKEKHDTKAQGHIKLEHSVIRTCLDEVKEANKDVYCFEIITKERVWLLAARTHQDMNDWIQSLQPQTTLNSENDLIKQAEISIKSGATKHFHSYEKLWQNKTDAVN
eukprot:TRINITY_DN7878_c0_g1_i2.p1 TRINITY_DN7878_c0_g1~~TRINITY_DN7878_c0_g1_i2.p1  ORF type:complete len:146 (-),score=1.89 TRINITY_DN7878_c0_g1_i2:52-489(-)